MLLKILSLALMVNLHASDDCDKTFIARLFGNMHKELSTSIYALQQKMSEIKNHQIEYIYSTKKTEYSLSGTHHTTTNYYRGEGDIFGVLGEYEEALNNLNICNVQLAMGDGAFLGVCMSILGNICKWDTKKAGIGLFVSSLLLTIVKNKHLDKVPYLTMPQLTPDDNYFGYPTNFKMFAAILGASSVTYFGIELLKRVILDKIFVIEETINTIS